MIVLVPFILILLLIPGCKGKISSEKTSLKEVYSAYFPMGVAVSSRSVSGETSALILDHFVSITPENDMKIGPIHPQPDTFNWEPADRIVAFARENGLKVRGHTLCWHNQVPSWWYQDDAGADLSKDSLLARMKDHIFQVAGRYKDDIYAWDVVNEAISDKQDEFYRDSKWYQICGEEFIQRAFEYAHEAAPNALLFYNDYSEINPVKREKIYQLVKNLKEAGVPIDGVGLQGHWSIYEPSEEVLRSTIDAFTDLGVQIQITELDVSVYPKEHSRRARTAEDDDTLTEEMKTKQAEQYEMIFRVFREKKDAIQAVTFWNISDRQSWLDNFPVQGRKDYPLLFDQNFQPKESYYKVVNF